MVSLIHPLIGTDKGMPCLDPLPFSRVDLAEFDEYRSVWQPDGSTFWYSRLDQFIAARPHYGKAVEPVRVPIPEPSAENGSDEAKAKLDASRQPAEAETASEGKDTAPVSEASFTCNFPSGRCRYSDCEGKGHCLAAPPHGETEHRAT
jgi:hypothetical protein